MTNAEELKRRRIIATIRAQALIERCPQWDEVLDWAEEQLGTGKPAGNVVQMPIGSRRANVDERLAKAMRVDELQRYGLAWAIARVRGDNQ